MGRVSETLAKIAALNNSANPKKNRQRRKNVFSASVTCTISISRTEIIKHIVGEIDDYVIKEELRHVLDGLVEGQVNYRFDSWEGAFFRNLHEIYGVELKKTSVYYYPE